MMLLHHRRIFCAIAVSIAAATPARAAVKSRRPIQPTDMVGVWEAVDLKSTKVFVFDLRQSSFESYAAMVSADTFLFSVHSMVTKGHRMELLCDGQGNAANLALKVVGDGWAAGGEGQFDAILTLTDGDSSKVYKTWHLALFGLKGKLVKNLYDYRQAADQAISDARNRFEKALPSESRKSP